MTCPHTHAERMVNYYYAVRFQSGVAMIYIRIQKQALRRDRPARRHSRRPDRPKPVRAPLCVSYSHCLDISAHLNIPHMPCRNCTRRQDQESYDLRGNDMLDYYLLLAAIFYPKQWRGSLFHTLRNLSYEVRSESQVLDQSGFQEAVHDG
jgi:hypothetical protein